MSLTLLYFHVFYVRTLLEYYSLFLTYFYDIAPDQHPVCLLCSEDCLKRQEVELWPRLPSTTTPDTTCFTRQARPAQRKLLPSVSCVLTGLWSSSHKHTQEVVTTCLHPCSERYSRKRQTVQAELQQHNMYNLSPIA